MHGDLHQGGVPAGSCRRTQDLQETDQNERSMQMGIDAPTPAQGVVSGCTTTLDGTEYVSRQFESVVFVADQVHGSCVLQPVQFMLEGDSGGDSLYLLSATRCVGQWWHSILVLA